ncbi:MAG: integrase, partial [Desulfuromonadales bacterium]|nr:integrase [Desulfuromonadales bacterium]
VNRTRLRKWLDGIFERIDQETFRFAEAFPGASEKEKAFFAAKEGWQYSTDPRNVLIGDYIHDWMERIFPTYSSESKRRDYRQAI